MEDWTVWLPSTVIVGLLVYGVFTLALRSDARRMGRLLVLLALAHLFLSLFFLVDTSEGEHVGLFQAVSKGAPLYIYLAPLAALASLVLLWRGRPGQYVWVCALSVVQFVASLAAQAAWQQRLPQLVFGLGSVLLFFQTGISMLVSAAVSLGDQVPLDSHLAFLQYSGWHTVARSIRSLAERHGWHYMRPRAHGETLARGTWRLRKVRLAAGERGNAACLVASLRLWRDVWPLRVGTSEYELRAGRKTADSRIQASWQGEYHDHRGRERAFTLAPTPGRTLSSWEVQELIEVLESGRRFLRPRAALTIHGGGLWYERWSAWAVRESPESLEELLSWMEKVALVLELLAVSPGG